MATIIATTLMSNGDLVATVREECTVTVPANKLRTGGGKLKPKADLFALVAAEYAKVVKAK